MNQCQLNDCDGSLRRGLMDDLPAETTNHKCHLFGLDGGASPSASAGLRNLFGEAPSVPTAGASIVIETGRLRLRPYGLADANDHARLMADPKTFRFSERGVMLAEEAWGRLLRHAGQWTLLGFGMFAIEEKESGRFVGETGFGSFRRSLGPSFDPFPEVSWSLCEHARGRGYASEAACAAHEWMNGRHGIGRRVCIIHEENEPSLRVAAKLGYRAFSYCLYRGYRAVLLATAGPATWTGGTA